MNHGNSAPSPSSPLPASRFFWIRFLRKSLSLCFCCNSSWQLDDWNRSPLHQKNGGRYLGDSLTRASSSRRRDFLLFFLKFSAAWWGKVAVAIPFEQSPNKLTTAFFDRFPSASASSCAYFSEILSSSMANCSSQGPPVDIYKMNKWTPKNSDSKATVYWVERHIHLFHFSCCCFSVGSQDAKIGASFSFFHLVKVQVLIPCF